MKRDLNHKIVSNWIVERLDIEEVISDYVELRNLGRYLMGVCVFPGCVKDTSMNLIVDNIHKTFFCFRCMIGGDIIKFIYELDPKIYNHPIKICMKLIYEYEVKINNELFEKLIEDFYEWDED
jgi:DNA primase